MFNLEESDINNEEIVTNETTNNINTNTIENEVTNKPNLNQTECSTIGCKDKADYKITTLDHQFVYTCLKHHNSTLSQNKDNVFNIILL